MSHDPYCGQSGSPIRGCSDLLRAALRASLLAVLATSAFACTLSSSSDTEREAAQDVIGGTEAIPGEFPWQAQLSVPGFSHWCGGSVLDTQWVLTAAHCVVGHPASDFTVRLGVHRRSMPDANVQTRSVQQVIRHPSYNAATIENDLALLQLSSPVTYTPRVQPISLRTGSTAISAPAKVSGWGQTTSTSASSDVLMKAVLPVVANATCNAAGTLSLTVQPTMICAGFLGGDSGGCHGDSGGPLVVERNTFSGGYEQIGIVSWGVPVCTSYTVFTRLSAFTSWIRSQIGVPAAFGDVDNSGCVDAADVAAVSAAIGQSVPPADAALDLNHDGVVNIFDRLIVLQNVGDGCS